MELAKRTDETLAFLSKKTNIKPEIAIILGSGLGVLEKEISNKTIIPYENIPHFTKTTIPGHKGQMIFGKLCGKSIMCMQGRFHYYEGYSLKEVTYPIRVMQRAGVRKLIITNASGGVNRSYVPGDLILIEDQINLYSDNVLIGRNEEDFGTKFPDMTEPYNKEYIRKLMKLAKENGIKLTKGVYTGIKTGPSYETPAEIRYLERIGSDVIGMSTVQEVIVAKHSKMDVLGISCITNMACGLHDSELTHHEVLEVAQKSKDDFIKLIKLALGFM